MSMSMPTLSVRCQTYALHLTHTASWPPTRSGELFNCKHPDYRPVYAERAVRLARIRTPSGSCQPCAPNCLKLPFTTGSSGSILLKNSMCRYSQKIKRL